MGLRAVGRILVHHHVGQVPDVDPAGGHAFSLVLPLVLHAAILKPCLHLRKRIDNQSLPVSSGRNSNGSFSRRHSSHCAGGGSNDSKRKRRTGSKKINK